MNSSTPIPDDQLLQYQAARLKELIEGIRQCCQFQTGRLSRKFGVHEAEIRCLLLFRGERYLTVKGIAFKLGVAKSRVTKVTVGLQDKGLIQCSGDPADGRVKLFSLTRPGEKKCDEMAQYIKSMHELLLLELDAEQRRSVMASLESLRVSMEALQKIFAG